MSTEYVCPFLVKEIITDRKNVKIAEDAPPVELQAHLLFPELTSGISLLQSLQKVCFLREAGCFIIL